MKFFIIGGNGRTGQLVISAALQKGHTVTALVRPGKAAEFPIPSTAGLSILEGDPLSSSSVEDAMAKASAEGHIDAVIMTLNARRTSDSPFSPPSPDTPPRLMTDVATNAMAAMRQCGVPKIVVMSMMGVGSSAGSLNFAIRFLFSHSNMRLQNADHNAMDAAVREARSNGIQFVMPRPAMLAGDAVAEVRVCGDDGKGAGFMPKISRESVARFIVEAAETNKYDGQTPVIVN